MKFCALSSGSSGNCQYIEYKDTKILIDAGLSGRKIENLLRQINVFAQEIDAILITHEHIDHIKGVGVLSKKYGIKIFANMDTYNAMQNTVKNLVHENVYIFTNEKAFDFKDINILPISTFHDCSNGCGFVITAADKKISILTDTGWVNSKTIEYMKGSDIYYIEANHDVQMLMNGTYSYALKQRILSTRGHLSNDNAAEILSKLIEKKKEKVILAHLSKDNNIETLAARTIIDYLYTKNILEGIDYILEVAKREEISTIYELGG